ncbi:MAG: hypothetical protein WAM92_05040 [Mycobacterium sp.]
MGIVFRLLEFWWVILPVAGAIAAGVRAWRGGTDRQSPRPAEPDSSRTARRQAAYRRELTRVIREHDRTDARWLTYELDAAKLLDFPQMTDMRNPLTLAFHKAKLNAQFLRPESIDDIVDDPDAQQQYCDAVRDYVTAFDVAESEAIRRRRTDFSSEQQQQLARAQHLLRLAADPAATPQERQRAYERAEAELEGLIALPAPTRAAIERRVIGEIDR